MTPIRINFLRPFCFAVFCFALFTSFVRADTLTDEGTAAGLQCDGSAVNDSGIVAGSCLSTAGVQTAFVANAPGTETVLPPLVAGRDCAPLAITNAGLVIGSCEDASGRNQTVTWQANQPSAAPLVLNSSGGVATVVLGGNHQGAPRLGPASAAQRSPRP
ncbi:hypothetical protein [Trinickia mobilis]|uniref:hypothetical protein n=1 Tax=Trinickia mobilis TaxID=2816356 RepID=UPI001A8C31D0|nr:hypothetical protein [Trinickia mobilis]